MVDEAQVKVLARLFVCHLVVVAGLNVVVFPSRQLIRLALGQPPGTRRIVKGSSNKTAAHQVDSIVVAKVHGCPPDPASVCREEELELGEAVAHEQGFKNSIRSMERGESTEWNRGIGEVCGVQINTEDGVDTSQSSRRSVHAISGRDKSIFILIPWWCAGEDDLNGDTKDAHPAKSTCEDGGGTRSGEDEDDQRAHCGSSKVHDAVGKPSQDIQNGMLVGRENVGKVGTIENVFQGGQNSNPDVRTILGRDKSIQDRTRLATHYRKVN